MCRCIVLYFYYFICIINIIFFPPLVMRGCTSWRIDPATESSLALESRFLSF